MYEDKRFKLNINWKSMIIKLAILLLIVFLICFIVFRPKRDKSFISLENNIVTLKEVAIKYFRNNLTLEEIGDYDKVSLKELIDEELIKEQKDTKGNTCNPKKSYAYLTKTRDEEFVLKINMNCGDNEESKTYNLTSKDLTVVASKEEEIVEPEVEIEEDILVEDETVKEEEPTIKEEIQENEEIADNSNDKNEESNKEHINFGNDELVLDLHNPNSNKKIYYKHLKYGDWTEGNKYGYNIETSTKEVNYYNYCYNDNCVIDRQENSDKYSGFISTFSHSEIIPIYRYVYVVWSTSSCIKGLTNTGIVEYR